MDAETGMNAEIPADLGKVNGDLRKVDQPR